MLLVDLVRLTDGANHLAIVASAIFGNITSYSTLTGSLPELGKVTYRGMQLLW